MTEQLPKDAVTLALLRKAIAEYQKAKAAFAGNCSMGWDIDACRADAWRAAFEWREGLLDRCGGPDEYHEGMALIREKLQS